jgi:hypothetical protein
MRQLGDGLPGIKFKNICYIKIAFGDVARLKQF